MDDSYAERGESAYLESERIMTRIVLDNPKSRVIPRCKAVSARS